MVDIEFEQYCKINNFDISIDNIKKRYVKIGDDMIKKDLKVVQDHPKVVYYMRKLNLSILNKIIEKQNELIKYKNKLINEFNNRIEQKADQLSLKYLDRIFTKLDEEKNLNFNQIKIKIILNHSLISSKKISFKSRKMKICFYCQI